MKILKAVVAAAMVIGLGGGAAAVEFRNYDGQNYEVKITSPTMRKQVEFRAMTRSLVICVDKCKFHIKGVGTVYASRDDIVTVEGGKLTATRVAAK